MNADDLSRQIIFQADLESPLGHIKRAGFLEHHYGMLEKPTRTLHNYACFYLLRGQGALKLDHGSYFNLAPGDFCIVFPEMPHWYGPPTGSSWDEVFIVFSGPLFDLWRQQGLLDPFTPVRRLLPLDYWLRRMQDVISEQNPLQRVCSLQSLLAEAIEACDHSQPRWLDRARRILQSEDSPLEDISAKLGMSYESFRKRFANATGVSPGHYRKVKSIDKACAMMVGDSLSNKEIAERLHFCDEFNFSRTFRK